MLASAAGAAGAVEQEQVGEAGHGEAEIGDRAVGPHVVRGDAAPAAESMLGERPGERVEAGGVDEHVELVQPARGPDAARLEPLDRVAAQVDQRTCSWLNAA